MGPDQGIQVCKSNKKTVNYNEKADVSGLFVQVAPVNGQDFLSAETGLPEKIPVEAPASDVESPADVPETDGRIPPDFFPVQQPGKVLEKRFEVFHV